MKRARAIATQLLADPRYHGNGNIGDARRHSAWNYRMTLELENGPAAAWVFSLGREIQGLGTNSSEGRNMDFNNNREGRQAALEGRPINEDNLMVLNGPEQNSDGSYQDYHDGAPAGSSSGGTFTGSFGSFNVSGEISSDGTINLTYSQSRTGSRIRSTKKFSCKKSGEGNEYSCS